MDMREHEPERRKRAGRFDLQPAAGEMEATGIRWAEYYILGIIPQNKNAKVF
jgi:hypothetical protein